MFVDLLPEIQEQIISHVRLKDLKSLSLTNSHYNEVLKKYLRHTLTLPRHFLEGRWRRTMYGHLDRQLRCYLQDTRILRFPSYSGFVSKQIFKTLGQLEDLEELHLQYCGHLTDDDVSLVCSGLISLRVLDLSFSDITDDGCAVVGKLLTLQKLILYDCRNITDLGVSRLVSLKRLRSLNLGNCVGVTEDLFDHICKLEYLEDLVLLNLPSIDLRSGQGVVYQQSLVMVLKMVGCQHLPATNWSLLSETSAEKLNEMCVGKLRYMSEMKSLKKIGLLP